jgi:hypothetical protein
MGDGEFVQFLSPRRGYTSGEGHFLGDGNDAHSVTDERGNFLPRFGESRASGLNGDLRPRQPGCFREIGADRNHEIPVKADGPSKIDADMLGPSSDGADKFQSLFLDYQAGDA